MDQVAPFEKIAAWILPIQGDNYDLEELPIYLEGSKIAVIKNDEGYFLRLSVDITGPTYDQVLELAREYIEVINGAAKVLIRSHRAVELSDSGYFGIDDSGRKWITVLPVQGGELRMKGGHATITINGNISPDERLGAMSPYVELAKNFPAKRDALILIGRRFPTWAELYVVYELVEKDVGRRKLNNSNWISIADAQLFRKTACSYAVLGRNSRHGNQTSIPPPNPMTHTRAIEIMRELVRHWVSEAINSAT